jgi:hypothetical protein
MLSKIILQHEQVIQELNILQLELDSAGQQQEMSFMDEQPMMIDSADQPDLPLQNTFSTIRSQTLRESKI